MCESFIPRFAALSDPDGEGGMKPLGTGELMQEGFAELRQVRPPQRYAEAWDEAMDTLIEAGEQLAEAERLGLAGEAAASGEAQSRALFDLEARAHEFLGTIPAPFTVCFAE